MHYQTLAVFALAFFGSAAAAPNDLAERSAADRIAMMEARAAHHGQPPLFSSAYHLLGSLSQTLTLTKAAHLWSSPSATVTARPSHLATPDAAHSITQLAREGDSAPCPAILLVAVARTRCAARTTHLALVVDAVLVTVHRGMYKAYSM